MTFDHLGAVIRTYENMTGEVKKQTKKLLQFQEHLQMTKTYSHI